MKRTPAEWNKLLNTHLPHTCITPITIQGFVNPFLFALEKVIIPEYEKTEEIINKNYLAWVYVKQKLFIYDGEKVSSNEYRSKIGKKYPDVMEFKKIKDLAVMFESIPEPPKFIYEKTIVPQVIKRHELYADVKHILDYVNNNH